MLVEIDERGRRAGQWHHWSRWTDAEVRWVLMLREMGMSYRAIAEKLEMPRSTVAAICRGDIRSGTNLRREEKRAHD